MKTIISIIVPVYNVEKYFNRCINSILNQTFKDYEVILVDDGSKDNSSKMCDEYALKYTNFKVIHKDNAGLGFARNSGLEVAKGKYVMFVDSDDYLERDMIENLYNDLLRTSSDTCIGGFRRVYNDRIDIIENKLAGKTYENKEIVDNVLVKMFGRLPDLDDYIEMSVWKVLFSNEIIQKNFIRFPSEREFISEDIIFDIEYYRCAKRLYMSSDTGYCYCNNEESLTTKYRPERFKLQKILYQSLIERTEQLGIYELSYERLMNTFVSITRYCIKLEQKFCYKNGYKTAKENIKQIVNDPILNSLWTNFDSKAVPIKNRVVNNLITKKNVSLLFFIMKLKNKFNI